MSLNFYIILVGLFNIYMKKSCFPGCLKVSFVVPVFKKVERSVQRKSTALLAFIPWLVKSLKNLELNLLDHLEKSGFFHISTVVSDRASDRYGATPAVPLNTSKAILLHKLKSYGISCWVRDIIPTFLNNRQLRV